MDDPTITKATFVFDVNYTVSVETLAPGSHSFTVDWAGGPNYVNGYDLFYEADGTEHTWADDDVREKLLDVVIKHYPENREGYRDFIRAEARRLNV